MLPKQRWAINHANSGQTTRSCHARQAADILEFKMLAGPSSVVNFVILQRRGAGRGLRLRYGQLGGGRNRQRWDGVNWEAQYRLFFYCCSGRLVVWPGRARKKLE